MNSRLPIVFVETPIVIFIACTIGFYATNIDLSFKQDKEPIALLFLVLLLIYFAIYAACMWLYYKSKGILFRVICLVMGGFYIATCAWMLLN